jgi:hypothetical protein
MVIIVGVDGNPSGIIPTILQPPQPIEKNFQNVAPLSGYMAVYVGKNPTHIVD